MRNKYLVWIAAMFLAFLTVFGLAMSLGRGTIDSGICRFYFTSVIEVKDGELVVDDESGQVANSIPFQIGKDIKDTDLHLVWETENKECPGFLTAFLLKDSTGKVVTYVTGDSGDFEIDLGEMKAGDYDAEFQYFTQEKEFRDLLNTLGENVPAKKTGSYEGYSDFGKTGTWAIDYAFELETQDNILQLGRLLYIASGVLLGIFVILLIFLFVKKDRNRKFEYDERQEIYRGRGFQYGFFTMIVYYFVIATCVMCNIPFLVETEILLLGGVVVGLIPYACYCIWKDAYVSLNEKKNSMLVVFSIIALANLLIGIKNLTDGTVVMDDKLTGACLPFLLVVMMVIVLITMLAKRIRDRKEEDE